MKRAIFFDLDNTLLDRDAAQRRHWSVFVGDDPARDVAGAAALGLRTCWISHGQDYPEGIPLPDLRVSRVQKLAELL